MNAVRPFKLLGVAHPKSTGDMLEEICEHFVEHADVKRTSDLVLLQSENGIASIQAVDGTLQIELTCPTQAMLEMSRIVIAEHLFYFAGEDPFELNWSEPASLAGLPNIHQVTVVSAEDVTPHMRRIKVACVEIAPFMGGDMHVRILVPPKGRPPVWPGIRDDGRVAWPVGQDELLVRVYTIRAVDVERKELWIDVLQHPAPGVATPGADFARDVLPGETIALLGPGGGGLPVAQSILLIGDESALPAIARIASEVPAGTRLQAIIEVLNQAEEQPLPTAAAFDIRWLHRESYLPGAKGLLAEEAERAIIANDRDTFIWVACEKQDVRAIRVVLKGLGHNRKKMYVAWYWERDPA